MTFENYWQTWLFVGVAVFTIAVNIVVQPSLNSQLIMLVPAVALLGLPHGALDFSVAQVLWPLKGWRGKACFFGLYVGLTLLVIGVWTLFPGAALFAFLIYSAMHFSGDWDDAGYAMRCIGGVTTIGAPALFWQNEVAVLFGYLAPESAAKLAALLLAFAGGFALACFIAAMVLRPALNTNSAIEQGVIWMSAACLPPLVYFIVYFCTLHSVRHFSDALEPLENRRFSILVAAFLSVATILAGFTSFIILQQSETHVIAQSIVQIIFIGVAALTVPHMILVDRFQKRTNA